MTTKKKIAVAVVTVVLGAIVMVDVIRPSRYRIGMSLSEAKLANRHLAIGGDGCVASKMSPYDLQTSVHIEAHDVDSGEELQFNHYGELLHIRRAKYLGLNILKLVAWYKGYDYHKAAEVPVAEILKSVN